MNTDLFAGSIECGSFAGSTGYRVGKGFLKATNARMNTDLSLLVE